MGVDLKLLPIYSTIGDMYYCSLTVLDCGRCRDLWAEIDKLSPLPLDKELHCYLAYSEEKGTHYGPCTEDSYGEALTYLPASALLTLKQHHGVLEGNINKAVWAYLAALPPDTKIVLYWC